MNRFIRQVSVCHPSLHRYFSEHPIRKRPTVRCITQAVKGKVHASHRGFTLLKCHTKSSNGSRLLW